MSSTPVLPRVSSRTCDFSPFPYLIEMQKIKNRNFAQISMSEVTSKNVMPGNSTTYNFDNIVANQLTNTPRGVNGFVIKQANDYIGYRGYIEKENMIFATLKFNQISDLKNKPTLYFYNIKQAHTGLAVYSEKEDKWLLQTDSYDTTHEFRIVMYSTRQNTLVRSNDPLIFICINDIDFSGMPTTANVSAFSAYASVKEVTNAHARFTINQNFLKNELSFSNEKPTIVQIGTIDFEGKTTSSNGYFVSKPVQGGTEYGLEYKFSARNLQSGLNPIYVEFAYFTLKPVADFPFTSNPPDVVSHTLKQSKYVSYNNGRLVIDKDFGKLIKTSDTLPKKFDMVQFTLKEDSEWINDGYIHLVNINPANDYVDSVQTDITDKTVTLSINITKQPNRNPIDESTIQNSLTYSYPNPLIQINSNSQIEAKNNTYGWQSGSKAAFEISSGLKEAFQDLNAPYFVITPQDTTWAQETYTRYDTQNRPDGMNVNLVFKTLPGNTVDPGSLTNFDYTWERGFSTTSGNNFSFDYTQVFDKPFFFGSQDVNFMYVNDWGDDGRYGGFQFKVTINGDWAESFTHSPTSSSDKGELKLAIKAPTMASTKSNIDYHEDISWSNMSPYLNTPTWDASQNCWTFTAKKNSYPWPRGNMTIGQMSGFSTNINREYAHINLKVEVDGDWAEGIDTLTHANTSDNSSPHIIMKHYTSSLQRIEWPTSTVFTKASPLPDQITSITLTDNNNWFEVVYDGEIYEVSDSTYNTIYTVTFPTADVPDDFTVQFVNNTPSKYYEYRVHQGPSGDDDFQIEIQINRARDAVNTDLTDKFSTIFTVTESSPYKIVERDSPQTGIYFFTNLSSLDSSATTLKDIQNQFLNSSDASATVNTGVSLHRVDNTSSTPYDFQFHNGSTPNQTNILTFPHEITLVKADKPMPSDSTQSYWKNFTGSTIPYFEITTFPIEENNHNIKLFAYFFYINGPWTSVSGSDLLYKEIGSITDPDVTYIIGPEQNGNSWVDSSFVALQSWTSTNTEQTLYLKRKSENITDYSSDSTFDMTENCFTLLNGTTVVSRTKDNIVLQYSTSSANLEIMQSTATDTFFHPNENSTNFYPAASPNFQFHTVPSIHGQTYTTETTGSHGAVVLKAANTFTLPHFTLTPYNLYDGLIYQDADNFAEIHISDLNKIYAVVASTLPIDGGGWPSKNTEYDIAFITFNSAPNHTVYRYPIEGIFSIYFRQDRSNNYTVSIEFLVDPTTNLQTDEIYGKITTSMLNPSFTHDIDHDAIVNSSPGPGRCLKVEFRDPDDDSQKQIFVLADIYGLTVCNCNDATSRDWPSSFERTLYLNNDMPDLSNSFTHQNLVTNPQDLLTKYPSLDPNNQVRQPNAPIDIEFVNIETDMITSGNRNYSAIFNWNQEDPVALPYYRTYEHSDYNGTFLTTFNGNTAMANAFVWGINRATVLENNNWNSGEFGSVASNTDIVGYINSGGYGDASIPYFDPAQKSFDWFNMGMLANPSGIRWGHDNSSVDSDSSNDWDTNFKGKTNVNSNIQTVWKPAWATSQGNYIQYSQIYPFCQAGWIDYLNHDYSVFPDKGTFYYDGNSNGYGVSKNQSFMRYASRFQKIPPQTQWYVDCPNESATGFTDPNDNYAYHWDMIAYKYLKPFPGVDFQTSDGHYVDKLTICIARKCRVEKVFSKKTFQFTLNEVPPSATAQVTVSAPYKKINGQHGDGLNAYVNFNLGIFKNDLFLAPTNPLYFTFSGFGSGTPAKTELILFIQGNLPDIPDDVSAKIILTGNEINWATSMNGSFSDQYTEPNFPSNLKADVALKDDDAKYDQNTTGTISVHYKGDSYPDPLDFDVVFFSEFTNPFDDVKWADVN